MKEENNNKELIAALCKAQSKFKTAVKDVDNPFFKKKYADLSSVWNACKDELSANDLFVSQIVASKEGKNYLKTRIYHKSGDYIESEIEIVSKNPNDPQSLGSGITYMRRYSLAAILGIIVEDDDGEGAMGREEEQKETKKATKQESDTMHKLRMEYREILMCDPVIFPKEDIQKLADKPDWDIDKLKKGIDFLKKERTNRENLLQNA